VISIAYQKNMIMRKSLIGYPITAAGVLFFSFLGTTISAEKGKPQIGKPNFSVTKQKRKFENTFKKRAVEVNKWIWDGSFEEDE